MMSGSDTGISKLQINPRARLPALARAHDLHAVAGLELGLAPGRPWHYCAVEGDRDPALADVDGLLFQECRKRRGGQRFVRPVDADARVCCRFGLHVST